MDRADLIAVVEVGPDRVRGPGVVVPESESAALDFIDDDIALLDDYPVAVDRVWGDVLTSAAGEDAEAMVLVCPSWWPVSRVDQVRDAGRGAGRKVDVLQRSQVLRTVASAVVEFASDFVLVFAAHTSGTVLARDDAGLAEAVADEVAGCPTVIVDAPSDADGELATAMVRRLRTDGVVASRADHDRIRRAAAAMCRHGDEVRRPVRRRVNHRGAAALAGALLSAAAASAGVAAPPDGRPSDDVPMTLLVEGRVGVRVPALWAVQRIPSGPGSARVQVLSPTNAEVAVHITQSRVPPNQTTAMVADSLRAALDEQPPGVFVDFVAAAQRAEREVIAYREVRGRHHTQWLVFVDGAVRIGVGCQGPPYRDEPVRYACDEAVRSAHAVF